MAGQLATDLRHGVRIATVEVRRSVRAVLTSRRQLMGIALLLVLFSPVLFSLLSGGYALGLRFRAGTDLPVVELLRPQVVAWIGSLAVVFGLRALERAGDADHADLLLTLVRPRAVVTGLVLAEYARVVVVFGSPLVAAVAAFALGAGTPLMIPAAAVGVLPLLALGLTGGFTLGYLVRLGYRRLGWSNPSGAWTSLLVAGAIIVGVNVFAPSNPVRLLEALAPLGALPVGPYADLLLVASPVAVSVGTPSVIAAGIVLASIPLLLVATWHLAPAVWYADPVTVDGASVRARLSRAAMPAALARRRVTRLVWWQWVRGIRAPAQFVHLTYFLFMAFPIAQLAISNPQSSILPVFVAVLGAFLTGGTFGLNPLGAEGSMLPAVLTTPSPGRTLTHARILAGTLLWLPLTLLAVVLTGWYSVLDPVSLAYVLAYTVVLAAFSSLLALGLGAFAPRFEAVRAFGGAEAPTPTTAALLGHSFVTTVVAVAGIAAVFVPVLIDAPPFVGGSAHLLRAVGFLAWATLLALVASGCYRYAVARLDGYTYE
ncbi:hypothetical protein SAMN05216388_1005150 [Halorientalis persicus]|uniref:ABC-2 type transport system permease protein n=1 Tax=Halorientalis persicus TaxID=1367881 RepID=A0A1H8JQK5_9EURY|nr:hypothetical protein [Halorientalis persicus]SEN83024.1 hypothetical protein SAMN05216388_1005150 [Halorientalis persicus]